MKEIPSTALNGSERLIPARIAVRDASERTRRLLEPVYPVHPFGNCGRLTEFLPVSSTAHLRIAEALMRPAGCSACSVDTLAFRTSPTGTCTPSSSRLAQSWRYACSSSKESSIFSAPSRAKRRTHLVQPPHLTDAHCFCITSVPAFFYANGAKRTWQPECHGHWRCSREELSCGSSTHGATAMNRTPRTSRR